MPQEMRREFADRDDLVTYLAREFPEAAALDASVSETRGGVAEAERLLQAIDPVAYGWSRNSLHGRVTRLAPYIRHGVLTLRRVRDFAVRRAGSALRAAKLITELGWRDYWQRLYCQLGEDVWHDREPYKTGLEPAAYSATLPDDIRLGQTGLACMDAFALELSETGYLHNHARMWVAAYVVHWRRVRWQAGARWFLEHLLDGDPASNNLSWQWVASTFSSKPYYFNRENLERYTEGRYCSRCPQRGKCVFEGAYDAIELRLFPSGKGGGGSL